MNYNNVFFRTILTTFIGWFFIAFAERGIVVAVNDHYLNTFFLGSLDHLRNNLKCNLPIEVWFVGDELSELSKTKISNYPPIKFCDLCDYVQENPNQYRGWQLKGWLPKLTSFHEVILMDADVFFYQNPEILFSNPLYVQTKCYLFQDSLYYQFPIHTVLGKQNDIELNLQLYKDRRRFIRSLIPSYSPYLPKNLTFYWEDILPSIENPFPSEHIDSGCVAIDIESHRKSIDYILALNQNRVETYKYIYGDKETFWLGCEMAQEPYVINNVTSYHLINLNQNCNEIYQFLDDQLFYQQKNPRLLDVNFYFVRNENEKHPKHKITKKEHLMIYAAHKSALRAKKMLKTP